MADVVNAPTTAATGGHGLYPAYTLAYLFAIAVGALVTGVAYAVVKTGQVELPGTAPTPTPGKGWSKGAPASS